MIERVCIMNDDQFVANKARMIAPIKMEAALTYRLLYKEIPKRTT